MMPNYIAVDGDKDSDDVKTSHERKITFPADSILNAVIQDGDVHELLRILNLQKSAVNLNQTNHTGLTALHHAVLANNVDSVKLLLTYGADVRAQDTHGFSPLHTAAALGLLQITSLLVVFGADVFAFTKQRELAIDVAKDVYVSRMLSDEMCLRIHQELYWKSIVYLKFREVCSFISKFVLFIIRTTILFTSSLRTRWKSYRQRGHIPLKNTDKDNELAAVHSNAGESSNERNNVVNDNSGRHGKAAFKRKSKKIQ